MGKVAKLETVKAMHQIVSYMNDEDAYMSWINLVPDQATEEDFVDLAENDMDEVAKLFREILARFGKSGWCLENCKTFGAGKI
jgi:hypothetical protein